MRRWRVVVAAVAAAGALACGSTPQKPVHTVPTLPTTAPTTTRPTTHPTTAPTTKAPRTTAPTTESALFEKNIPGNSLPETRVGSLCKDGTWSSSTGRGTCSHHGGVVR